MSDLLDAVATLKLLDELRTALRRVVQGAIEQKRDFTTRSTKLRVRTDHTLTAESAALDAQIAAAESDAVAEREHIDRRFQSRKSRISRAAQSARQRKREQIEAEEKSRTVEIQHALLAAGTERESQINAANQRHDAFIQQLAETLTRLQQAEQQAHSTLAAHRSLRRLITHAPAVSPDLSADHEALHERLNGRLAEVEQKLSACRKRVLPVLFRFLPVWLLLVIALGVAFGVVPELRQFQFAEVPTNVWATLGGVVFGMLVLHFISRQLIAEPARAAVTALEEARKLYDACGATAQADLTRELSDINQTHAGTTQSLNADWRQVQAKVRELREVWEERIEEQIRKLNLINEERRRQRLLGLERGQREAMNRLTQQKETRISTLQAERSRDEAGLAEADQTTREKLEREWQTVVLPLFAELNRSCATAQERFPPWQSELWSELHLPGDFLRAARFGELKVDWEAFCNVPVADSGFALPEERASVIPLTIGVPHAGSLLFETRQSGQSEIIGALNSLVLRLLTSAPPGRVAFTIFDPVGLGQNFAGIMHLADFEERVINSRIWTQQAQFEQRLADLNEHIEKVTQMYLRNEYADLAEYNAQAGRLAEKYHFLVIADFPVNFSDLAAKRLQNIIASGPRCGVYTLIHWDQRRTSPAELVPDELRKHALRLVQKGDSLATPDFNGEGLRLSLDAPPAPELATQLLQRIGQVSVDSYRVEMPFGEAAPPDDEIWSLDTTRELRVPIGRTGATKLQYLSLGQDTRQHGLIAGKTGSGKSNLFHVIITNLSLWCAPEQVEFYLVDFKKGVEFKCYATHKLPHARVIAIESDREFGLSVLQRVDEELKRRGDLFRKVGTQDLAGYKRAGGSEAMPRVLLLIDEFQEFFVEDDRISQAAALLLDRIVRQGRAFGIHVLLGSQTLGGAYSLARATIGQMVVRVALQCNEADAYLIMNEDNPAPRLLSRPGEAIYNDDGGTIQGNSPFQVVWLPDSVRDEWLAKVQQMRERQSPARRDGDRELQRAGSEIGAPPREPIVFEGNAPADVRDNVLLRELLAAKTVKPTKSLRIFLGAPNSIKGPTEVVFRAQSGNHLLIVGQREEATLAMVLVAQIVLAAQCPGSRLLVFNCSAPDSAEATLLQRVAGRISAVKIVSAGDTQQVIAEIAAELTRRVEQPGDAPATFLLIHGLQHQKKLRFDEEASFSLDAAATAGNPGLLFNKLVCEGASHGIHVIATCDSYNDVMRMLSRKALSEFEMRVVFQMSATDSASLIESPAANNLGLHRAILYNAQQGWTETFRPYALPDEEWLKGSLGRLK